MATISFKSVGTKVSENRAPTAPVPLPIGNNSNAVGRRL
jgi:hypothetical protein